MKQITKKLRSKAGESLAETLVAVLVIALALTMLAGMITSTANIVKASEDKMDDYYKISQELERLSGEDESTTEPPKTKIVITEETTSIATVPIMTATNGTFSKYPVIAYALITDTSISGTED